MFIDAKQENGVALFQRQIPGPVVMLNLLRFREVADYSADPHLAADEPISGREAYQIYMDFTEPFLHDSGGEVIFAGDGGHFLIGPMDEQWDYAMLVRHKSVPDFMAFAQNEAYLAGMGHRTAALEDSRLLPLEELKTKE